MLIDSGLHCLALIAQLHRVAVDAPGLQHRFGRGTGDFSVQDLLRAAQSLGFRARHVRNSKLDGVQQLLPAIAIDRDGGFLVLAGMSRTSGGAHRYLIQKPGQPAPAYIDRAQFEILWSGELVLLSRRERSLSTGRRFNLKWFIPPVLKYRSLFLEVLVASFFLQLFALVTPLFFQVVMDKVLVHKGYTTLDVLALGFVALVAFEAVIGGLRNYLFSHTTSRVDVELGARLFHQLASLPLAYFESRQVGQTVARVRELDTVRNFITGAALTLLIDLSFTFVFLAVLWYYSPTLTWIVAGSLPFYILLSVFITPILRQRLDAKFRCGAANQAFLTEVVTGIQTVKTQALEPQMQRRWEDQLASYVTTAFQAQNIGNIANQVAGLISKITTGLIIWWGAHLVIAGALTVGQLVAFNMIAARVTAPVLKLVQLWQEFQQAGISLERLGDILDTPAEAGALVNRHNPGKLAGAVTFERVRYRYHPDAAPVLDNLSLSVQPGEIVGLVGRSGSGKSTLAKLVQRLYVPEAGSIRVDGMNLAMVDCAWLRRNIGVVQQESFLFNRSVRDNIALANPGLSFDQVVHSAKVSGAHEFITRLDEGYDTLIGEQGCNLSGGQRQRIAIARALINNPRILILDEATSALDYESERVVQDNMGAIAGGRTVFIIAHRLSTVRHCDQILVLDQGHIVESGSHDALLAANGYYASLYAYQNHSPVIRTARAASALGAAGGPA